MFDALGDLFSNLLLFLAVFCGVTLVLVLATLYFIYRRVSDYMDPDISKLNDHYARLRADEPKASQEKLVKKVIQRQAMRAGMVGAVTSLGGIYTLPIGLPVDILLSARIQSMLVEFIAAAYGRDQNTDIEARIRQYLITTGGLSITRRSTNFALRFAEVILGKSFAKIIPFAGALIGFVVNYTVARAMGNAALGWYSGKIDQLGGGEIVRRKRLVPGVPPGENAPD